MEEVTDFITQKRNGKLFDKWSIVHLLSSGALAVMFGPVTAFVITTVWEPVENFIISPIVAKFGIVFGYETLKNSLSDIFFNFIGIALATILF